MDAQHVRQLVTPLQKHTCSFQVTRTSSESITSVPASSASGSPSRVIYVRLHYLQPPSGAAVVRMMLMLASLHAHAGQTGGGDAGLQRPGSASKDQSHLQHRQTRYVVILAVHQLRVRGATLRRGNEAQPPRGLHPYCVHSL